MLNSYYERNMRTILGIVMLMILAGKMQAKDIVWHQGSVVLKTNEVVVGDIARQGADLILLKNSQGAVFVYPTHKVSSFRFYDSQQDVNRVFIAIGRKYYERVVYGKISVLRIQKGFDQSMDEKNSDKYDFYIQEDERLTPIKSFRNKYFDRIREDLELRLISYKHLDPNTKHGAVSLIILYNKDVPLLAKSI
jgi:hypothetical protein